MASIPAHSYRRESSRADETRTPRAAENRAVMTAFKLAVVINLLTCLLLLPALLASGDAATTNHQSSHYNGF